MSTNTAENKAAAVIAYAFPWPGWVMTNNYTHHTAPTQFVEAAGICFAYRRFGNRRFGVRVDIPLLFFMHFTGTILTRHFISMTRAFFRGMTTPRTWQAAWPLTIVLTMSHSTTSLSQLSAAWSNAEPTVLLSMVRPQC